MENGILCTVNYWLSLTVEWKIVWRSKNKRESNNLQVLAIHATFNHKNQSYMMVTKEKKGRIEECNPCLVIIDWAEVKK
jgi:hypothetical protein